MEERSKYMYTIFVETEREVKNRLFFLLFYRGRIPDERGCPEPEAAVES